MQLNSNDLIILHLYKNRQVGIDVANYFIRENNINVEKSLLSLLNKGLLEISTDYDIVLPKYTIPQLKDILRESNLKVGGNKQELINRIIENQEIVTINDPISVYHLTDKGQHLVDETQYIMHFYNGYIISPAKAHKIAITNLNSEDKIEYIYLSAIKSEIQKNDDYWKLGNLFLNLAAYYRKDKQNKTLARTYYNLSYYVQIENHLPYLSNYYGYDESSNSVVKRQIEPNFEIKEFYEQLLYNDNIPEHLLIKFFEEDIRNYFDINEEYSESLVQIIISYVKDDYDKYDMYSSELVDYAEKVLPNNNRHKSDSKTKYYGVAEVNTSYSDSNKINGYQEREIYQTDDDLYLENQEIYQTNDDLEVINQNSTKHKNTNQKQQEQPEVTKADMYKGCGCIIFIILFISGCSALVF